MRCPFLYVSSRILCHVDEGCSQFIVIMAMATKWVKYATLPCSLPPALFSCTALPLCNRIKQGSGNEATQPSLSG